MKFRTIIIILIVAHDYVTGQRSSFDDRLAPLFRNYREAFNAFIKPKTFARGLVVNVKNEKVQRQFASDEKFFCDVNGPGARSKIVPKSVHKLTPGDIDVVGAIGDSLTAANGAFAIDVLQLALESRGVSWSIGGQGNWRKFLTLPNIIKEFNPKLYGYSVAEEAATFQKASKFNVAEAGAQAIDTVHQAKNLVKRMRSDANVNMKTHWKLVTYLIGGNDFCADICYNDDQEKIIQDGAKNLIQVLRILRENLPRLMVNVVLPPDVSILTRFKNRPDECKSLHYLECPCMFSLNHLKNRERSLETIRRWNEMTADVVKMPEFHDRIDFVVNLHRFLEKSDIPRDTDGNTDFTYMSKDCFHPSQKGHALLANSYWNSMLTPVSQRSRFWKKEFKEFRCPTQNFPYLSTPKNS